MMSGLKSMLWVVWLLPLLAAGCLRASPPPNYYTLVALATEQANVVEGVGLAVVVKNLPDALDRSQILTRQGFQVELADQHRWAAPLWRQVEEVLAVNLGHHFGPSQVLSAPWPAYFKPTHRLLVDVLHFDGALCGEVQLQTRWVITDGGGKKALAQRTSTLQEVAGCDGYADLVAAQSRLLAQLGAEVAANLRTLLAH